MRAVINYFAKSWKIKPSDTIANYFLWHDKGLGDLTLRTYPGIFQVKGNCVGVLKANLDAYHCSAAYNGLGP
jgi:hypothetical protein